MPGLDTEQRPSRRLWILAAAGALALHLGCGALAVAHLQTAMRTTNSGRAGDRDRPRTGLAAARGHRSAARTGYRCFGGVAGARRAEGRGQGNRAAEGHADRDRRSGSGGDNDDNARSRRKTSRRSPRCRLPRRRNRWRRKRPRGRRSTARSNPIRRRLLTRGSARTRKNCWQNGAGQLSAYLNLHKRYPEVKLTKAAKVKVGFVLDRLGHVVSMRVIEGSGDAAYDEAALAMIRRSDPVPRPPPVEADDGLNFTLDVIFPKGKS